MGAYNLILLPPVRHSLISAFAAMVSPLDGQPCEGGARVHLFPAQSPGWGTWHVVGAVEIFVGQINK